MGLVIVHREDLSVRVALIFGSLFWRKNYAGRAEEYANKQERRFGRWPHGEINFIRPVKLVPCSAYSSSCSWSCSCSKRCGYSITSRSTSTITKEGRL